MRGMQRVRDLRPDVRRQLFRQDRIQPPPELEERPE
jgi:hypothetical protein